MADRHSDVARIQEALREASRIVGPFAPGEVVFERKGERGDPVTAADHAVDAALKRMLPGPDEGWLSEETRDDPVRLERRRVWVVDPLDGTREFVEGIPEYCISIGLLEDGVPVAGGVYNPATRELVVGSVETGVTYNGEPARRTGRRSLDGARVLASRSEVRRGEWERFSDAPFEVVPCGSVAYKLGLVAAGRADATWTLVPKHEWDVVGGAALVRAAGGTLLHADGTSPTFNQLDPELPDFLAGPEPLLFELRRQWLDDGAKGPRGSEQGFESRTFWEGIYRASGDVEVPDMNDRFLRNALRYFGDVHGKRVLDIGCGSGAASLFFAAHGAEVTSIDFSSVATARLSEFCERRHIDNIDVLNMSAMRISELRPVDLVFGSMILHHIEPFEDFVDVLWKTLAPSGKGYFFENSANSDLLIWFRTNLTGRFWIPKYGDDEEFPLTRSEIDLLREKFEVQVEYPYFHFFRMASEYVFKGRFSNILTALDDLLFRFERLRKYSYRQELFLSRGMDSRGV